MTAGIAGDPAGRQGTTPRTRGRPVPQAKVVPGQSATCRRPGAAGTPNPRLPPACPGGRQLSHRTAQPGAPQADARAPRDRAQNHKAHADATRRDHTHCRCMRPTRPRAVGPARTAAKGRSPPFLPPPTPNHQNRGPFHRTPDALRLVSNWTHRRGPGRTPRAGAGRDSLAPSKGSDRSDGPPTLATGDRPCCPPAAETAYLTGRGGDSHKRCQSDLKKRGRPKANENVPSHPDRTWITNPTSAHRRVLTGACAHRRECSQACAHGRVCSQACAHGRECSQACVLTWGHPDPMNPRSTLTTDLLEKQLVP